MYDEHRGVVGVPKCPIPFHRVVYFYTVQILHCIDLYSSVS